MNSQENYADEEMEPNPELSKVTNAAIGAAIAVHKELGPGHMESIYENALAIELRARGISYQRQVCLVSATAARRWVRCDSIL